MTISLRHVHLDGGDEALEILVPYVGLQGYVHEVAVDGVVRSVPSNTWTQIWRTFRPDRPDTVGLAHVRLHDCERAVDEVNAIVTGHNARLTALEARLDADTGRFPPDVEGMITMPASIAKTLADASPVLHINDAALLYVGKSSPSNWLLISADR